ncbi:MAG TPA: YhjD/YihY/BrkB family envelope integrity protein, partial [Bryobacteraceae bacterium]|nr:YhjD/YihY/BrkB family envelope integrity protein [Bryobacteraceae bacterium]
MANPFVNLARLTPKQWMEMLGEMVKEWNQDHAPRLGASLAFYTLLSLAPLVVVIVAMVAFVYGRQEAQDQIIWQMRDLIGADGAKIIRTVLERTYQPKAGIVATALGLVSLIVGASTVVVELREALNLIWQVPAGPKRRGLSSVIQMAKKRFYSF